MKNLKKLLALLLALGLVAGICVPAWAGEDNQTTPKGTVTIEGAESGKTYNFYQILKPKGEGYEVLDAWKEFVTFTDNKINYGETTPKVELTNDSSEAVKAFLDYAKKKEITAIPSAEVSEGKSSTQLDYGYYLIDYNIDNDKDNNATGGLFELDGAEKTLQMKRDTLPRIKKKIVLDDGSENGKEVDCTTVQMGDKVKFRVTAILPGEDELEKYGGRGYQCYLVDEIFSGLTINEDVSVYIDDDLYVKGGEYSGHGNNEQGGDANTVRVIYQKDHKQFSVKFGTSDNWGASLAFLSAHPGAKVTLEYTANVIAFSSEKDIAYNTARLHYRDKTTEDKVYLYNFTIVVNKKDKNDNTPLSGARFVLMNSEGKYYWTDGKTDLSYHVGNKVDWVSADYDPVTGKFSNYGDKHPSVWVSDANNWKGHLTFGGIAVGKYQLIEVTAPNNYNKLESPIDIEIKVSDDEDPSKVQFVAIFNGREEIIQKGGIPWASDWEPLQFVVDVENSKGTLLPSTGGIGTTMFYIGGGALVVGAACVILFKKRKGG